MKRHLLNQLIYKYYLLFSILKLHINIKITMLVSINIQFNQLYIDLANPMKTFHQSEIKNLIDKSNGTQRSIQHICQYCIECTNPSQYQTIKITEVDIALVFQSILHSHRMIQIKLIAMQVMTQILAGPKKKAFLKHLTPRMKFGIMSNKRQLESKPQSLRTLATLLQRWKNENIFCDSFCKKIEEQAGTSFIENMRYQVVLAKFTKYQKWLVMQYRDANKNRNTSKILKDYLNSYKLKKSVEEIVNKKQALTSENKLTNTEAKIMLQTSQILIDQHIQALNLFKDSVELVKTLFEEEAKNAKFTKEELCKQETS